MGKSVIVIGSGGREHALAWKLSKSKAVSQVYIAPGNAGSAQIGENVNIQPDQREQLIAFCQENSIDLVVIGPDDALASGLADDFRSQGISVFGPSKKAARIESSKAFAKDLMEKMKIPTARYATFQDAQEALQYVKNQKYPLVVKASGLALGKGVIICDDFKAAKAAIKTIMLDKVFADAGETVVIEEFLSGSEVSFHALSDGKNHVLFPPSQDHKQAYDGDKGPNTGGMGVFGPISHISQEMIKEVDRNVIKPALSGLKKADSPFVGCLYPGLMMTSEGPMVLEYNARFGDPETQIYMRLLDSDLFELLEACATGKLIPDKIKWKPGFAVSVVLASGGYPEKYENGLEITGMDKASGMDDIVLFHAGTRLEDNGKVVTAGGRVVNVTAYGETLDQAIEKAYTAVEKINFQGKQYRKDIGRRELRF